MSQPPPRGRRTTPLVGAAILAVGLLAGCGGSDPTEASGGSATIPSVASVPQSATVDPSPTQTAAPTANRPLIRNDTSTEEVKRMLTVWLSCLADRGVPVSLGKGGISSETRIRYKKELAACQTKEPEQLADRYKREHPQQFQAQLRKFIKCMKNEGQKIIFIAPDGWGVSDEQAESGFSPDNRAITKCESQAYR
jgi:hypothetical protein